MIHECNLQSSVSSKILKYRICQIKNSLYLTERKKSRQTLAIQESPSCDTLNKQAVSTLQVAFIVSGSSAISEIILWPCKYSHSSLLFPTHIANARHFAHCNLSVGEHEYLFVVCICSIRVLPCSPTFCQMSHFVLFGF